MTPPPDTDGSFDVSDVNRVRRYHHRAKYDRETVFGILDRGLVAHVAFIDDGRPVVIPMVYGRDGDRLFLHAARKGRIATSSAGSPVSIAVTLLDGLVVARSLFDSSMNYRAVVLHGRAVEVEDEIERLHALRCVSEHNLPGRWDEVRLPTAQELKATTVIAVDIESASAKVRDGGVVEELEAGSERVWAGVVPLAASFGAPAADASVPAGLPLPESIQQLLASDSNRRG